MSQVTETDKQKQETNVDFDSLRQGVVEFRANRQSFLDTFQKAGIDTTVAEKMYADADKALVSATKDKVTQRIADKKENNPFKQLDERQNDIIAQQKADADAEEPNATEVSQTLEATPDTVPVGTTTSPEASITPEDLMWQIVNAKTNEAREIARGIGGTYLDELVAEPKFVLLTHPQVDKQAVADAYKWLVDIKIPRLLIFKRRAERPNTQVEQEIKKSVIDEKTEDAKKMSEFLDEIKTFTSEVGQPVTSTVIDLTTDNRYKILKSPDSSTTQIRESYAWLTQEKIPTLQTEITSRLIDAVAEAAKAGYVYDRWDLKDVYAILGLKKTATKEEIKKRFQKMMQYLHPDLIQNNSSLSPEQRARAVQHVGYVTDAYAVLSNDEKRKKYDDFVFNDAVQRVVHPTEEDKQKTDTPSGDVEPNSNSTTETNSGQPKSWESMSHKEKVDHAYELLKNAPKVADIIRALATFKDLKEPIKVTKNGVDQDRNPDDIIRAINNVKYAAIVGNGRIFSEQLDSITSLFGIREKVKTEYTKILHTYDKIRNGIMKVDELVTALQALQDMGEPVIYDIFGQGKDITIEKRNISDILATIAEAKTLRENIRNAQSQNETIANQVKYDAVVNNNITTFLNIRQTIRRVLG